MPIAFVLKTQKGKRLFQMAAVGAIAGPLYSVLVMVALGGLPPSVADALAMGWLVYCLVSLPDFTGGPRLGAQEQVEV